MILGSKAFDSNIIYYTMSPSLNAQRVKNLPTMQVTWVRPLGHEDPLAEGNGNPLQYSCLEKPMDRGPWQFTDHRVAKSQK